jgi:transcriptional regulator with XRE-family HTH domain
MIYPAFPKARRKPGEMTEKAEPSTVFISRIERGKESPSVDNLVKIARALGVGVRDLVRTF